MIKLKSIWEKSPLKSYIYFAFGINVLTLLSILLAKNLLPPEVPLFYGNAVGESQLIKSFLLVIAPTVSLLILVLNLLLLNMVDDSFLKKALVVSAFFVSILSCITVLKIIFLVGFF